MRWRLDSVPKFRSNYLQRHHLVPKQGEIYQRVNRRDTGFVSRKGVFKVSPRPQAIPAVLMTNKKVPRYEYSSILFQLLDICSLTQTCFEMVNWQYLVTDLPII